MKLQPEDYITQQKVQHCSSNRHRPPRRRRVKVINIGTFVSPVVRCCQALGGEEAFLIFTEETVSEAVTEED